MPRSHCRSQDYSQGFEWIKKSAEQNDIDGIDSLGECYYYGWGIDVDYKQAIALFEKSAEFGNPASYYNLARCYFHGHGVDKNIDKAKELARKAIDLDETIADTDGILK